MVIAQDSIERARPHFVQAIKDNNSELVLGLLQNGFPSTEKIDGIPILHFAAQSPQVTADFFI